MKKRIISGLAAAALCTSLFTATAYAEDSDSEKLRLITAPISDFCPEGTDSFAYAGGDYYSNYNLESFMYENLLNNNFLIITDEDKEHWRETGEFRYKTVDLGFDDEVINCYSAGYDYMLVIKDDKKYLLQKTDDPAVFKTIREFDDAENVTADTIGNYFEIEKTDNGRWVNLYKPDGSSVKTFFECEKLYLDFPVADYSYSALVKKNIKGTEDDNIADFEQYFVDSQGNAQKVLEVNDVTKMLSTESKWGYINLIFICGENSVNQVMNLNKFSESANEVLTIDYNIDIGSAISECEGWKLCEIGFINGDRAVGKFCNDYFAEEPECCVVLLDVSDPSDIKVVSDKAYLDISKSLSDDVCDIFLACDGEKWGYIDRNGQELGWFDDAGEFGTEYAPVIKDGKMFLINKDLEPVTEAIEADGCFLVDDDLYLLLKDNERYLVTFAEPQEKSNEPENAPELTETDIPNTGSNDIHLFAVLLTAGAVTFAASKKHK